MAGSVAEWERYLRWNAAVADVVYSPEAAGTPVYLDLDDDVLAAISEAAKPEARDHAAALTEAVKATLILRGASQVLQGHLRRLYIWHSGSMLDPPPTLGLLAMLSLAAERMHAGDGMKQHNFYGRLAELVGLTERELEWFRNAYRTQLDGTAVSAQLWQSLNDWLEMLEGNRGLPTAMALGHEHIGLPLSQALVRRTDREKFSDLFTLNSLPPRSTMPAFDMENLIAEWMSRQPCPASNTLEHLWRTNAELRARITDVALQTLAAWDGDSASGTAPDGSRVVVDMVRAKAILRRSFPARRLEIGLVLPARTGDDVAAFEALDVDGAIVGSLDLVPVASGYLGLADPESIDPASFLGGDVLLRRTGHTQPLRRRARRVVPMRRDELLLAYVECERVQLGEESLVLARSAIAPVVTKVLEVIARPGFVTSDDIPAIPEGWTLVSDVQVLSSIPADLRAKIPVDLNALQPLSSSQIVLQGGLRLPGNIAKWSSSLPPELRVSTAGGGDLAASITCTRPLTEPPPQHRDASASEAVLLWDLAEEALPDGDYEITVNEHGEKPRVVALRLRSADTPAVAMDDELAPITHDPDAVGFGLIATRSSGEGFQGARDGDVVLEGADPPSVPVWYSARKDRTIRSATVNQIHFPPPDEKSCMVTGAHYMDLPTVMPGSGIKTIEGVCRTCGLVKRQAAFRGKAKSVRKSQAAVAPKVDVSGLAPVRATQSIDWAAAYDAVCHVGAGKAAALRRIASQMEATDLFGDVFERRLELLGHIEIDREVGSLVARSWEVVEPLVIGLEDGSATLIGFRSERMLVAVEDHVWACKGTLSIEPSAGPPVVRVEGLSGQDLASMAEVIAESTGRPCRFIADAASKLCASLPPLSQARLGLPTTTAISARSYERWEPATARFEESSDANAPGAFRLTNFTRTYLHRTPLNLGAMRATLGDARIVKYLAAADSGQSLLGYDADARVLYVPLGADLPGLYGRTAVLASGCLPRDNLEERILEYPNVSARLAGHLDRQLMT